MPKSKTPSSSDDLVPYGSLPDTNALGGRRPAPAAKGPTSRYTAPKAKRAKAVSNAVRRGAIRED